MICTDTNIVVYVANGTLPPDVYGTEQVLAASIVKIEALGFGALPVIEEHVIRHLLEHDIELIALDTPIVERAIVLRQSYNMRLGDAIIAATALEHDCELWTANVKDFKGVYGLKLYNPVKA